MRPKCMRCVVYIELYYPTEDSLSARPTIFIWARGYIASWHHPVTLMHTFARPVQMLCQCLMNRSFNCWLQILTYDSVLLRLLFCCRFILHHTNHGFNSFLSFAHLLSCNRSIMRLESPVSAKNDHLNKKKLSCFSWTFINLKSERDKRVHNQNIRPYAKILQNEQAILMCVHLTWAHFFLFVWDCIHIYLMRKR